MEDRIRVNLTVDPVVDHLLRRMSKATGVGKATIISQWLLESLPQLEQLALAMEQAASGNIDAFNTMIGAIRSSLGDTKQLEMDVRTKRRAVMRKKAQSK